MDDLARIQNGSDLVDRIKNKNKDFEDANQALRRVIEVYGPKVKGYIQKSYSAEIVEEVWSETIKKVWDNIDGIKSPLEGWLIKTARNCAADLYRFRNKKVPDEYEPPYSSDDDVKSDPDSPRNRAVREIIENLSYRQQTVLKADLAYLSGNSPHTTVAPANMLANELQTTENNIYKIRSDGLKNVRKKMEQRGYY